MRWGWAKWFCERAAVSSGIGRLEHQERDQTMGLHNVRDCLSLAVKLKYGAIVYEHIE